MEELRKKSKTPDLKVSKLRVSAINLEQTRI